MKALLWSAVILLMLNGCGDSEVPEEDTTDFRKMDWMLGIWEGKQGEADIYESWRRKNYRIMEGTGYTTSGGQRVFAQNMRIEQSNNSIFFVIVDDNENTEDMKLQLSAVTDSTVEFVNPAEGYPQRLIYNREPKNRMSVSLLGKEEETSESSKLVYRKTQDYSEDANP